MLCVKFGLNLLNGFGEEDENVNVKTYTDSQAEKDEQAIRKSR